MIGLKNGHSVDYIRAILPTARQMVREMLRAVEHDVMDDREKEVLVHSLERAKIELAYLAVLVNQESR